MKNNQYNFDDRPSVGQQAADLALTAIKVAVTALLAVFIFNAAVFVLTGDSIFRKPKVVHVYHDIGCEEIQGGGSTDTLAGWRYDADKLEDGE